MGPGSYQLYVISCFGRPSPCPPFLMMDDPIQQQFRTGPVSFRYSMGDYSSRPNRCPFRLPYNNAFMYLPDTQSVCLEEGTYDFVIYDVMVMECEFSIVIQSLSYYRFQMLRLGRGLIPTCIRRWCRCRRRIIREKRKENIFHSLIG